MTLYCHSLQYLAISSCQYVQYALMFVLHVLLLYLLCFLLYTILLKCMFCCLQYCFLYLLPLPLCLPPASFVSLSHSHTHSLSLLPFPNLLPPLLPLSESLSPPPPPLSLCRYVVSERTTVIGSRCWYYGSDDTQDGFTLVF
jgi:hypothetical protein